jgi:hypothetical protein
VSALFPQEHLPPTDVFHEGSGVLIFVAAVWFGVEWSRIVRWPSRIIAIPRFNRGRLE